MNCRKWKPHRSHLSGAIVRGPTTRRHIGPKMAKWTLRVLKRLKGQTLAQWATRMAGLHGRKDLSFRYDEDDKLYIMEADEAHAFAHPRRISMFFHGPFSRGRKLAYEYLLDQIPFEDGDWIIDVGANSGDLCLAFRAMGRQVNIEAFEPSPGEFLAMSRNLEASSAVLEHRAHQVALWNEASEGLTFYLKPGSADSSILPIENPSEVITVPALRLDDALKDDGRQFRLLKLEAEGVEPEILEGVEKVLSRVDYVAADVGFERGEDAASTLPEVTNFLLQRGFEIVGFEGARFTVLYRNRAVTD